MALHRRASIAEFVRTNGVARVSELAIHFNVSEVTIRNDLNSLENDGRLIRDHGGAIASTVTPAAMDSRVVRN